MNLYHYFKILSSNQHLKIHDSANYNSFQAYFAPVNYTSHINEIQKEKNVCDSWQNNVRFLKNNLIREGVALIKTKIQITFKHSLWNISFTI